MSASVATRVAELPGADLEALLAALRWSRADLDSSLPPRVAFAGAWHPVLAAATRALAARAAELDPTVATTAFVREERDGKVFVELKKKFDGVVYKRRITTDIQNVEPFLSGELPSENFGQIGREIGYFQSFYHTVPKVFIGYDRLAFAGIDDPQLRITFDTNLRWRDTDVDLRLGDHGAPIALPCGDVLMEVKIPGACPLWLSHLLSDAQAFPTSFSKYGACYRDELSAGVHTTNLKEDTFCA